MPLPGPDVIGFGYVTSQWVDTTPPQDNGDSDLSSTSLLKSLIEPSESELDWLWTPMKHESERYSKILSTVRKTVSGNFFKNDAQHEVEAGLNIDFKELRKMDQEKHFATQVVPKISETSEKAILRRKMTELDNIGIQEMPFLAQGSFTKHKSQKKAQKRLSGLVAEILNKVEKKDMARRRSLHIMLYKKTIEKQQELAEMAETEEEREARLKEEEEAKQRKDELLRRLSPYEKVAVDKVLGDLPALEEPVFVPYGKKDISDVEDPQQFFGLTPEVLTDKWPEADNRLPSYDEFHATKDSFVGYEVVPKKKHVHMLDEDPPNHSHQKK